MRRVLGPLLVLLLLTTSSIAASPPEEVTICGQHVEKRGYLAADLDCGNVTEPDYAIWLDLGAVLELRGFTLTGASYAGVLCWAGCKILGGGGTITGAGFAGVQADKRLQMSDLTLSDNVAHGAFTSGIAGGAIDVRNGIVTGNGGDGSPPGRSRSATRPSPPTVATVSPRCLARRRCADHR
jgi:hypothetical protein